MAKMPADVQGDEGTVYVVDDERHVRESVIFLCESMGWSTRGYASATEFLEDASPVMKGCLVLDLRMPGMSGIELQQRLCAMSILLPVIFVSGHGDIPAAVQAMKSGALEFLEKPVHDQALLDAVGRALRVDAQQKACAGTNAFEREKLALLSSRELEVLEALSRGASYKTVARQLGISERTVQAHRDHAKTKLGFKGREDMMALVRSGVMPGPSK